MNSKIVSGGALASLIFAGGITGMVSAQTAADATGLTQEQVVEIALMEIPGEVIDVEQERHRGVSVFEVEILGSDGVEMEIEIAAQTGEILQVESEGADCDKDDNEA